MCSASPFASFQPVPSQIAVHRHCDDLLACPDDEADATGPAKNRKYSFNYNGEPN